MFRVIRGSFLARFKSTIHEISRINTKHHHSRLDHLTAYTQGSAYNFHNEEWLDRVSMKGLIVLASCVLLFCASCSRFRNAANTSTEARYVVISPIYNEIIWALGAQDKVVGVDLSTTYPPDVKKVQTVGYHRALSAEGILSLHPTTIIHDNNIGPPQVVQQLQQLNILMKTFSAKNDSFDDTKA
jgi:ABC-type hemin transport system substrate-binding protein